MSLNKEFLTASFTKLHNYASKSNYIGEDVYDGLNSRLFKATPLYKSKYFRMGLMQLCKKSPINLRKILLVPKEFNPKAGALFLLGNLNMYKATGEDEYKKEAKKLFSVLKVTQIEREKGIGWGYNFDWQARAFYVLAGVPNTVTSVYAGRALMEYYKVFKDEEALNLTKQIAKFILNEMILFEDENKLCFRYIPDKDAEVHNVNLLCASFLAMLNPYIDNTEKIKKAVNFSIADINPDGAWPYGTKPFHRWTDNFHTAFNLESLIFIRDTLNWQELTPVIEKVTDYYFENLFTEDGIPKYYNNKLYPIDIHTIAEVLIVINKLSESGLNSQKMDEIRTQIEKLIKEFQDEKGYFYYQKNRFLFNKIPYIRWGQAWMYFAISDIILNSQQKTYKSPDQII